MSSNLKNRPVPFHALAVHRPAAGHAPAAPAARGRVGFGEMLRRAGSASGPRAMRLGVVTPRGLDLFDDPPEPPASITEDETLERDDDQFAQDLLPDGAAMRSLLAEAVPELRGLAAETPEAIRSLASTIAGFCNQRTVDDSEGWSVHIELRADVLPETSLDLTVSAHWLQLRFQAGQPASRRLLCEHEPALRAQLDLALDRSREIAIAID